MSKEPKVKLTYTDDGFICHVCKNDNVPNEMKWLQKDEQICGLCMLRGTIKNVDGSQVDFQMNDDGKVTINA